MNIVETPKKVNRSVLFSSNSVEWGTPQELFDRYDKKYHFELDAAASHFNHKCDRYFSKEENGLIQDWVVSEGRAVWCNPPYDHIHDWVRKAYDENQKHETTIVMLLPARTDTRWFHAYLYHIGHVDIEFLKGRLKFTNEKGEVLSSAPFPSMIVIFNPLPF